MSTANGGGDNSMMMVVLLIGAYLYMSKARAGVIMAPNRPQGTLNNLPGSVGTGIGQALGGALGGWLKSAFEGNKDDGYAPKNQADVDKILQNNPDLFDNFMSWD